MAQERASNDTMSFIDWVSSLKRTSEGTLVLDDHVLKHAPESVKGSKAIVLELVAKNGAILEHACAHLRQQTEVVLEAVSQNGHALWYAASHWDDFRVVLAAVTQSWHALYYASDRLKVNSDILRAAKGNCPEDEHGQFRQFIGWTVKSNIKMLRYASNEIRGDRDIMLLAVQQDGSALQYASKELWADEEIVLAAVKQSITALRYADVDFRAGRKVRDIMLSAVRQDGNALQSASPELKADKGLVMEAVLQNALSLRHADASLQADKEVALHAVRCDGNSLRWASLSLRADKDVVLSAVSCQGVALEFAHQTLREDRDIVVAAVQQNPEAYRFAEALTARSQDVRLLVARAFLDRDLQPPQGQAIAYNPCGSAAVEKALASSLAVRGEDAPVVSVNHLSLHEDYRVFQCEASLPSGACFVCHIEDAWPLDQSASKRRLPTLQTLAALLVREVSKHTKVKGLKRVFINIAVGEDGDAVAANPWECERPLRNFITTATGPRRELIEPKPGISAISDFIREVIQTKNLASKR